MTRALIIAALILGITTPAQAQMACDTRDYVITKLGEKYGETRRGVGLSGPASVFEIWASDEKPYTWTILKVFPSGKACLMSSGKGWQADPPVAPGDPA